MSTSASPLAQRPFGELLAELAARTPAPGGGSAAAWAGALAAGLVEMAAGFTVARAEYADRHARCAEVGACAGELRRLLLELGERELNAYEPVLDALRLPEADRDRPSRVHAARSAAAESPLAIARAAAELAVLAAELAGTGNRNLQGDAVAGTLLAEAACAAAVRLVEINLAGTDDPRRREAGELARRALRAREAALE